MILQLQLWLHYRGLSQSRSGKKKNVYHDDLHNTSSGIQCKCNDFNYDFVVPEEIKEVLSKDLALIYTYQDEILLRVKAKPMKLYTVDFNF